MTQAIIFTNSNGGVSVCFPTGELSIQEIQAKDTPAGSLIINTTDLPNQYSDLFDAWELSNGVVTVSLHKAKDIVKKRLRIEREPLLNEQDLLLQIALEKNTDTTAIIVEKNRLRNVTRLADSATTLDALHTIKV